MGELLLDTWMSGDQVYMVEAEAHGISAYDGQYVLQFATGSSGHSADAWYLVGIPEDIRGIINSPWCQLRVEVTAWFVKTTPNNRFVLEIGEVVAVPQTAADWSNYLPDFIRLSQPSETMPESGKWTSASASVVLTPQAKAIALSISAVRTNGARIGYEYADAISLRWFKEERRN